MNTFALVGGSLVGLAALGVLAELAARAALRLAGRYYVWPPYARVHMPLDRTVFPHGDDLVRFEVNRLGERGAPLPADLSHIYRVIVAGGSAAECYFLDQPSTWPEVVGRVLREPANLARLGKRDVHIGNVARSLADCRQLLAMFSRILPHYPRSDLAILLVGGSDLVTWLEKHTPPTLTDDPIPPSAVFGRHPEGPFGWTPSTLALRRIASAAHKTLTRPIQLREPAGKRLAANRAMRSRATDIRTTMADPAPMLAHYERNLRALVALLQRHSSRVLVVCQPWLQRDFTPAEERLLWMFGEGRAYKEQVTTYYHYRLMWSVLERIDAISARVARELNAECIDVHSRIPADFDHYYDELHHTPKGCALLGRLVAEAIVANAPPSKSKS